MNARRQPPLHSLEQNARRTAKDLTRLPPGGDVHAEISRVWHRLELARQLDEIRLREPLRAVLGQLAPLASADVAADRAQLAELKAQAPAGTLDAETRTWAEIEAAGETWDGVGKRLTIDDEPHLTFDQAAGQGFAFENKGRA